VTALRSAAVGLAALALAASGCAAFHARAPEPRPTEGGWAEARRAATRRLELYDGFVHRATATATHLGGAEREARARRLGDWLDWTPEELSRQLGLEQAEAARSEEFFVAFYTADFGANDLDAPASQWRVALKVDGGELLPAKIEGLDVNATVAGLYPFVGPFDSIYRVRFPLPPGGPVAGKPFALEISSTLGKILLDYGAPQEKVNTDQPSPAALPP
jgi:hypothetical protein